MKRANDNSIPQILADAPSHHLRRVRSFLAIAACAWSAAAVPALGQPIAPPSSGTYQLDESGEWQVTDVPEEGSDRDIMARARRMIAQNNPRSARNLLNDWLDEHEETENPYLAEAYFLRGDARTLTNSEYWALYDYQEIVQRYRSSEFFPRAVEREYEIGKRYLNGLRTKIFWIRLEDATPLGEEIMVRVQELLPGSALAEKAGIELADYYYRKRELAMASEAYDVFLRLYPRSVHREHAMKRRIYANIARFKGPNYDASGLVEAQFLIKDFAERYPAEAERAGMSDALVTRLDESAAAQMLESARWYIRRADGVSAKLMLDRLERKHPSTAAAVTARELMAEHGWTRATQPAVPADEKPADAAAPGEAVAPAPEGAAQPAPQSAPEKSER